MSERQSNIELLRIFLIISVLTLHYNNPGIGGGLRYVNPNSINFYIMQYLQAICVCAVNTFVLISGYFLYKTNRRELWKILELILQVVIFRLGVYFLAVIIGQRSLTLGAFMMHLIPVNYFVILYIALYLISPFINVIINGINDKGLKLFLRIITLLFSIWPMAVSIIEKIHGGKIVGLSTIGAWGSQSGYTIVNFMLMYIIGACFRKNDIAISFKDKKLKLCIIYIIIAFFITILNIVGLTSTAYFHPLVITEAVLLFTIFKNFTFGFSKKINQLASGTFTIFLFHSYLFEFFNIERHVNSMRYLPHFIISIFTMYFISYIVHVIYSILTKPIFTKVKNKLPIIDIIV